MFSILCLALQIDKSLPRICFLSGLSGEETMMFVDAFPETGIENLFSAEVFKFNTLILSIMPFGLLTLKS